MFYLLLSKLHVCGETLGTRQQALAQYLSDVQNPASPNFHKWLTPAQFGSTFGASTDDIATLSSWLQSQGFTVEKVSAAANLIQFSGNVAQAQKAFNTEIHSLSLDGVRHMANTTSPQVPRSFTVNAVVPGAPTIGTATAGDTQATVAFSAPAFTGGATITGYTAISNPGGITGTGAGSPITVAGLTNGTAYTFTVTATNSAGTGPASAASNSVTPKGSQTITFANPGAQSFGTSPTLTATESF